MSKIDEMIERLCPDGVEYKTLGEIGTLTRGKRFVHKDAVEEGIPCIHYGELYTHFGVWATQVKSHVREDLAPKLRYAKKGDVVIVGAGEAVEDIGIAVAWLGNESVAVHDACYVLSHDMNPKYISYFCRTAAYHDQIRRFVSSGKISSISAKGVAQARIPVPPLEIQEKIVRVLDSFAELEAELEAELAARRAQYAYYRDQLLSFSDVKRERLFDVKWMKLGECGEFIRGNGIQKKDFREYGFPCIHYGQIYTHYGMYAASTKSFIEEELAGKTRHAQHGDLVIATTSENAEDVCKAVVWIGESEVAVSSDAFIYRHAMSPGYVAHFFKSRCFQNQKARLITGTKVLRLSGDSLARIEIPVPPLEEQQRIVDVLDKFDTLVNDISAGLPAEIEARRKQYEHYRDKLLTFKEKVA